MKYWQDEIFKLYTEAKQFEAGKYNPRFGGTAKEMRTAGMSVPSRDAMLFISNLLEKIGIFSEEETDSVVKNFNAASRRLRFLELLEIHSEEIKSSAAEIDEVYSDSLEQYLKVEAANRGREGRKEKYDANAAAREMYVQQKQELKDLKSQSTGQATDALNTLSIGLDDAWQEVLGSLKASFEDPTTMFEIKLKDEGDAQGVVNYIKPFTGDSEIEVNGSYIEFSADPYSDIAKVVNKVGVDKVEQTINDWLDDNTTGGVVNIMTPEGAKGMEAFMASLKPKKRDVLGPEKSVDDEDEVEYGSELPDVPKFPDEEDDRDYYRGSQRDEYGDDDVYTGGDEYAPRWAQEDEEEEHEGARRSPKEGYYERGADDPDYEEIVLGRKADLNKDRKLSEYEKKRGTAIKKAMEGEENNEDIKMSPQQINQWMYMQRAQRMQNNLRQNERWGNY